MILRDRVTVVRRELLRDEAGNPVYDGDGNDQYVDVQSAVRAEVRPLGSSETVGDRTTVQSRYRVFLPASATDVTASDAVTWRGIKLELQGDVEAHTLGGRVHHFEVIAQRVTG